MAAINQEPRMLREALQYRTATEDISVRLTNELIVACRVVVAGYHRVKAQKPGAHRAFAQAIVELEKLVGRP